MLNHPFNPHREHPHQSFSLCHYRNQTPKIQVARIGNIPPWYFEKVIFPQEHLLFFAPPAALLEIYTHETATTILSERIFCDRLVVLSEMSSALNP